MSIGRNHKKTVLQTLSTAKATAEKEAMAKKSLAENNAAATAKDKKIQTQVLSNILGVASKQRKLAALGKIILVGTAAELNQPRAVLGKGVSAELLNGTLNDDLNRLHDIPAIVEKQAVKRVLLEKYLPVVRDYIASGARHQNAILVHCLIWLIDVEQFQEAMELADVAIEQNQQTPPYIKRELSDFVVEEIAEWALRQSKLKESASPYIDHVIERVESKAWPVGNTIITGKLYKHAGLIRENFEEFQIALDLYEKAQAANDQAGCLGRIKKLKEKLNIQ
jgi:tetratricopeptide (TPR) repeat protein